MEQIKNYGYNILWNKVFVFILMSCVLHAGFFSLFFFYNGSIKDGHVEKSIFVNIAGSFMPGKVNLKKGAHRNVAIPRGSKIKSRTEEKRALDQTAVRSPQQNVIPANDAEIPSSVPVPLETDYKGVFIPESLNNTGGLPSEPSVSESSASGFKTSGENYGADGLRSGDYSGGSHINGNRMASSDSEASFQREKELRDIILTKIRKNILYPEAARKLGFEGDVKISFRISPDGTVNDVLASGKNTDISILEKAAISLIQNSAPYNLPRSKKMGEAVSIQIVISYRLEDVKR